MGLLSIILLGIIPTVLFLFGGAWAVRSQLEAQSDRQFFFYLLGGSALLLLVQFTAGLIARLAGWEALDLLRYMLIPVLLSFLALILLNLKALGGSSRQERLRAFLLGMALVLLLAGILVQTFDIGLIILAGALILALVWAVATRWDAVALLLSFLVLLGLARLASTELGQAVESLPDWLGTPLDFISWFSAALAVSLAAVLVTSVLRKFQQLRHPDTTPTRLWFSASLHFGLALLLLLCLAYTIFWLSIWDQTSDGVGGVLFAMQSGLIGVAAGAVMGIKSKSWFRSSGFFFALLVPALMFGAFTYGWSVSYHDLTERRAARIQAALERYHDRLGVYPAELSELTPRELLWVPAQVILRGEDWCYNSREDGYLLGVYWREYFSTPLELRFLVTVGEEVEVPRACEERLKELTLKYDFREPVEQP
jgi:hypothetical protein